MKQIFLLLTSITFTGCSVLSPVATPINHQYMIKSTSKPRVCTNKSSLDIQVLLTEADQPYNSYNMYYTNSPYELNQYSYSVWATLPQNTINQAVQQSIMNSCIFNNVVGADIIIPSQYKIKSKLLELKQNIGKQQSNVTLSILVQLINSRENTVQSSKIFTETTNIQTSPQGMSQGTSVNLELFLKELNDWLNSQIR